MLGIAAHIRIHRKPPASVATRGCWPVSSMIRSPNAQIAMTPRPANTASHSPIRIVRRTSRTACRRRPSSAAISGAAAPTSPVIDHISSPNSETDSDDAARFSAPSRATKITSTA